MTEQTKLPLKTERLGALVCFRVKFYELDEFIERAYGISSYSLLAAQEWVNGSKYYVEVNVNPPSVFDTDKVEAVKAGEEVYRSLPAVMNDLARRGFIEAGIYLIDPYW